MLETQRLMKVGDKLECGCTVSAAAWTREQARDRVYAALAEILGLGVEEARRHPETMVLRSLGLDTAGLRRLWGKFFVACDVEFDPQPDGGVKYLIGDEKLPMVPPSIGTLVDEVASSHSNPTFDSCWGHAF